MLAELVDGTTNADLCFLIAVILAVILIVVRAFARSVDGVLSAAVLAFIALGLLVL